MTVKYDKCENYQNIYWITILAAPSQIQLLEMSTLLNISTTLLFSLLSVPLSKLPYIINNHTCEVCIHLMNLKTETVSNSDAYHSTVMQLLFCKQIQITYSSKITSDLHQCTLTKASHVCMYLDNVCTRLVSFYPE